MMRKGVAMATILTLLFLVMSPATASAASVSKITSAKGVVCKTADGATGYLVAKKALKKGTSLTLKKVSNNSKLAKTYTYGVSKKWSSKKLAKALKRAKAYKVKVPENLTIYKGYKGKKLSYILVKKVKVKKPEPTPTPTEPEEKPSNDEVTSQATNAVATGAEVTVVVATSNTSYNDDIYRIAGTTVVLTDGENSVRMTLRGGKYSASASDYVPNGTYDVLFPRPISEVESGMSPYCYPTNETVTVEGNDTTKDIYLDPIPVNEPCDCTDGCIRGSDVSDTPSEPEVPKAPEAEAPQANDGVVVESEDIDVIPENDPAKL